MRLWDAGSSSAGDRLGQLQGVLDQLWKSSPTDQPVLVRDARWLIPLALSPTTDELAAYFAVAERIAETPAAEDRLEIYKASVQMAGGHLRSQLRHYILKKGVSLDENSLVLSARSSNALDLALTIQGLVPLLKAYEQARHRGEQLRRLALADAICQGISADPELFVNRVDLLRAYSMIEHLFITTDPDEEAVYTPMGKRHIQLLDEYEALISRVSQPLHEDCRHFRPVDGAYSPYGVIFGFSSNLTEHMVLKALQPDAMTPFSVEDVFTAGNADKLAWVSGWRKLPHIDPEVQRLFDYPQQFAQDMFERIERSLRTGVADVGPNAAFQTGRLFILSAQDPVTDSTAATLPDLPLRYIRSYEESRLLHDRQEGMFLVSYKTPGGWVAITKDILTEVLGAGCDVKLVGLPRAAVGVLSLMCPNLVTRISKGPCRSPVR